MGKVNNELVIKNENLFRAWVSLPAAILFILLSINSVATSGILLFQIIFILLAMYFSLNAISYAAQYTNELYEGKTEPLFENKNLSNAIIFSPLAILAVLVASNSITTSASVVFQTVSVLTAFILVLYAIAYAAFYTNDCYETTDH
ncbi:MAG: hypothetical protein KC484_07205 [Colwelliaceae bacterium]|jgi:hypothetical protein|nr:hypothetical protein [Colwelliaceae bacterium]